MIRKSFKLILMLVTVFTFILTFYPKNIYAAYDPGDGGFDFESGASVDEALGPGDCIKTALGCFPLGDTQSLTITFVAYGIGIAGGIALILIAYSAFLIMTSQGVPQRLQNGQTILYAALSGLVLIIFSTFIMRLLGISLLSLF